MSQGGCNQWPPAPVIVPARANFGCDFQPNSAVPFECCEASPRTPPCRTDPWAPANTTTPKVNRTPLSIAQTPPCNGIWSPSRITTPKVAAHTGSSSNLMHDEIDQPSKRKAVCARGLRATPQPRASWSYITSPSSDNHPLNSPVRPRHSDRAKAQAGANEEQGEMTSGMHQLLRDESPAWFKENAPPTFRAQDFMETESMNEFFESFKAWPAPCMGSGWPVPQAPPPLQFNRDAGSPRSYPTFDTFRDFQSPARTPCQTPPRTRSPRSPRSPCSPASPARSIMSPLKRQSMPASPVKTPNTKACLASDDDPNCGRFRREFCDISLVGKGQFASVYRAKHKTDQHLYAVKVQKPNGNNDAAFREVYVLASIAKESPDKASNLVKYCTSWIENESMYIQTELCECSLHDRLLTRQSQTSGDPRFNETDTAQLLGDVAKGLALLHSLGFAHMDIKPENILVSFQGAYKIADLGLVIADNITNRDDFSEGDCRYLAKELVSGTVVDIKKADIFSLGMACYEATTNPHPLPCNGDLWHKLRQGHLERCRMSSLSEAFWNLLQRMLHELPEQRPASEEIVQSSIFAKDDEVEKLREALREAQREAEKNKRLMEEYRGQLEAKHQEGPPRQC